MEAMLYPFFALMLSKQQGSIMEWLYALLAKLKSVVLGQNVTDGDV